MGAFSKSKGSRGELEVVQILKDHGWDKARRTHDGREQALRGDIANGPVGFHLEIKRAERWEVGRWWDQTTRDAGLTNEQGEYVGVGGLAPLLVFRRSRSPWLALLELDELLPLLKLRES